MKGESHFRLGGPPKMSTKLSNLREQGERGGGVGERGGGKGREQEEREQGRRGGGGGERAHRREEGERGRNRQERKGERRGR